MIDRYNTPEISTLWTEHGKFENFLKVELALLRALEGKLVPAGVTKEIEGKVKINPARVAEIEATTKHDVIAFCTSITEQLPDEVGQYFHFGVTSSDIIDTATTLQIKDSLKIILNQLEKLKQALKVQALEHKETLAMGRSHGMNAEPTSFGLKFLSSYCEFNRRLNDLESFYSEELTGQISGAVGNYTIIDSQVEKQVMSELKLKVEPVSTQVIPRDRMAKLIQIGGLIGASIERIATEIRLLHHSDINELHEGFAKGQKGSSIMPHKKNPISGENLCGLARILKSHTWVALDNVSLWHERDISHSSAERLMLPDHLGLLNYALKRLTSTVENLVINKEKIEKKVTEKFEYLSSYYLHYLIEKTNKTREQLYQIIQSAAFDSSNADQMTKNIEMQINKEGLKLSMPKINKEFLRKIYLSEVDTVFARAIK